MSSVRRYCHMNRDIKNITRSILFVVVLGVLVPACEKQEDPLAVLNIDTGLSLELTQTLTPNGGMPSIDIWTTDEVNCSNAIIKNKVFSWATIAEIVIEGFGYSGGICEEGKSKPRINLPLQMDPPYQSFFISITGAGKLGGVVNKTNEEYALNMESQKGFFSRNNAVRRIVPGMYWGYIEIKAGETNPTEAFKKIDQLLNQYEDKAFSFQNGDYTFFKVINNKVNLNSLNATGKFVSFAFKLKGVNIEPFINAAKSVPNISAHIYTYAGTEYVW